MEIDLVSASGLVKLRFSDSFIVPSNITVLEDSSVDADGVEQANLELKIIFNDDDDQQKAPLNFTWKVESFTETHFELRLTFTDPSLVSTGAELDQLQLIIRQNGLFRRKEDGIPIAKDKTDESNTLVADLPSLVSLEEEEQVQGIAEDLKAGGTSVLFITAVFQFFLGYGMNNVLSQVRSLSMVSHLMMM